MASEPMTRPSDTNGGACPTCGRIDLADALLRACLYLDGFVWVTDPEASELDDIQTTVASALGCKTWEQAMELAHLREARR